MTVENAHGVKRRRIWSWIRSRDRIAPFATSPLRHSIAPHYTTIAGMRSCQPLSRYEFPLKNTLYVNIHNNKHVIQASRSGPIEGHNYSKWKLSPFNRPSRLDMHFSIRKTENIVIWKWDNMRIWVSVICNSDSRREVRWTSCESQVVDQWGEQNDQLNWTSPLKTGGEPVLLNAALDFLSATVRRDMNFDRSHFCH